MLRILLLPVLIVTLAACAPTQTRDPNEPGEAELNARYALQYLRQGKLQPASERINIALELDPDMASAQSIAALIYQSAGQPSRAQRYYLEALRLDPGDSATLNNYGKFLCSRGRLAEAERQFVTASQSPTNPHPEVAYANAGLCAKRIPDAELAAQYFRAALDINPDMPLPLYQLAEINFGKKRYELVSEELRRYRQVADHTAETLWLSIRNERALGNLQEVDRLTNLLSEEFPSSDEARLSVSNESESFQTAQPLGAPGFSSAVETPAVTQSTTAQPAYVSEAPQVHDQRWLLQQPAEKYTILLIKSQQKSQLFDYLKSDELREDIVYLSYREGQNTWYSLLYGNYSNPGAARNSINQLPVQLTANSPTVSTFGDFQQLLSASY